MKTILVLLLFNSCALLNNKVEFNKDQELLKSIEINQSSNESVIYISKQMLKENIDYKKFKIMKDNLESYKYNKLIIAKSKNAKKSKTLNITYSKIVNSRVFEDVEKLKLRNINKDYPQYLKSFFKNKQNTKRLNIIRAIIDIDFPSMHYIDLIAQTTALSTKYDNLYDQINYYISIKNFLTASLYNVNVYLYKDTPTELLAKLLSEVNTNSYKKTRMFIEDIQIKVHKEIIKNITNELDNKNLVYGDLIKIKKGAS